MSTSPSLSMHSDFGGDPSGEGDNSRGAANKMGAKTAGRPSSTTPSSSSQVRSAFIGLEYHIVGASGVLLKYNMFSNIMSEN